MPNVERLSRILPLLEASALTLPGLAFLNLYANSGMPDLTAYPAHLQLVASLWGLVVAARLIAWRFLPRGAARHVATVACSAVWTLLTSYYAVATVGLQNWGKIITWPILQPYLAAPAELLEYLETPAPVALAAACVALAATGAFWHFVVGVNDWTDRAQARLSRAAGVAAICTLTVSACVGLARFIGDPPTATGEPVSLTLFPPPPEQYGQDAWPSDPQRQRAEDLARKALLGAEPALRPNVILIVSDALRADRMGIYGYGRETTPMLERRLAAARSAVRARAIAACAETSCGMPALLYSKSPGRMIAGAIGLSEVLRRLGYRSHVVMSGDHTNYYGLAQLYRPSDTYFDATTQQRRFVNDDRMVLDAISALPYGSDSQPVFVQIGLLSNHPLGVRWPRSRWWLPQGNYAHWAKRKTVARLTPEERELAGNFYDNGVRQTDALIESVLRQLDAKGYLRTALVLITSDHGEMLGEHDVLSHTVGVYQPVLDVPAVLIRYGYAPPPFPPRAWVSQTDLAPTLVAELGVHPPATWEGVPLQRADQRSQIYFQQGDEAGFVNLMPPYAGYKYWFDRKRARDFAFDLTADPAEQTNLSARMPLATVRAWRRLASVGESESPIP